MSCAHPLEVEYPSLKKIAENLWEVLESAEAIRVIADLHDPWYLYLAEEPVKASFPDCKIPLNQQWLKDNKAFFLLRCFFHQEEWEMIVDD